MDKLCFRSLSLEFSSRTAVSCAIQVENGSYFVSSFGERSVYMFSCCSICCNPQLMYISSSSPLEGGVLSLSSMFM